MPKFRRPRPDMQWVNLSLEQHEGVRRIVVRSDVSFLSNPGSLYAQFCRPVTLVASHVTSSYIAENGSADNTPTGWLGIGVSADAAMTILGNEDRFPVIIGSQPVSSFLNGAKANSLMMLTGESRAQRRCQHGDYLQWDWYGFPVAPWGSPSNAKIIGQARCLFRLN